MTTFTIDNDNNVTAYAAPEQAEDTLTLGAQLFTSQKELAKTTADWPASRLVETWNGFAGVAPFDDLKPVKKFTSRKVAINRIWQAIQKLAPPAQWGTQDAPEATAATQDAASNAPKAKKAQATKKEAPAMRTGTKKAKVVDMLKRDKGATNEEIQRATDWLPHTVRGFLSIAGKTLKIETITRENGAKAYHIA